MFQRCFLLFALVCVVSLAAKNAQADPPTTSPSFSTAQIEFFEGKVRPVLLTNCFECHGEAKQSGGLRLDSRAAILKGGDEGEIVSVAKPEESKLLKALAHSTDLKMPPKKKLPDADQALLAEWIRQDLPWPVEHVKSPSVDLSWNGKAAQDHWAFKIPKAIDLPAVRNAGLVKSPVDNFILSKLEQAGLSFSPTLNANREQRTKLLRRVTYDLTGLPPTLAEIDTFVKDESPDAFAGVVDRLLASPHYGEEWGRHWLDVARYATDNKNAAVYRDWVIRAFNRDMPYDKFLRMQIAGDLLIPPATKPSGKGPPPPVDEETQWQLGGMGLLRIGRGGGKQDAIDDSIDVVGRGMLGLSISCARCHDHKFDPIPTADYYSLYSIFENTTGAEVTIVKNAPDFGAGDGVRRKAAEEYLKPRYDALKATALKQYGDLLRLVPKLKEGMTAQELVAGKGLNPHLMMRWHLIANQNANNFSSVWTMWRDLESIPREEFAEKASAMIDANSRCNPALLAKLKEPPAMKSFDEAADRFAAVFEESMQRWNEAKAADPAIKNLPDKPWDDIRGSVMNFAGFGAGDAEQFLLEPDRSAMRDLRDEQQRFATATGPRVGLSLKDGGKIPATGRILIRGNPAAPGAEVPRRFLAVLSGENRKSFPDNTSGRLQLADAITTRDNPLTARVIVNRVWAWHFGRGIVGTSSDFGLRGERPTHPELLDYLAVKFMNEGWSLKKLHRMILLSTTYQQASDRRDDAEQIDPDNRLCWRANRQRLDLEPMRDSLLAASGGIDFTPARGTIEILASAQNRQRTVYANINRGNLLGVFRVFDLPNPDAHGAQRPFTTVPQQALFYLNGPFVADCARKLSVQPDLVKIQDPAERIRWMYRVVFGRSPTQNELDIGLKYINSELKLLQETSQLGYATFAPGDERAKDFVALPALADTAWQSSAVASEEKQPWVALEGTKFEEDKPPALVRRWKVPAAGKMSIAGEVKHVDSNGAGVKCCVVSNRTGKIGNWASQNAQIRTTAGPFEVQAGDVLDFIVINQSNLLAGFDSFSWAPTITVKNENGTSGEWQIGGSDAWQKYAQALLMSNEFIFID